MSRRSNIFMAYFFKVKHVEKFASLRFDIHSVYLDIFTHVYVGK